MSTPRSEELATPGWPAADAATLVNRQAIVSIDALIRPYLRRTPVIRVDRADFGLPPGPLVLKLELLQHTGSFKARVPSRTCCCVISPRPAWWPPPAAITG